MPLHNPLHGERLGTSFGACILVEYWARLWLAMCMQFFLLASPARAMLPDYLDRKSTRLNSSHQIISYAVFCLKKKKNSSILTIVETDTHDSNASFFLLMYFSFRRIFSVFMSLFFFFFNDTATTEIYTLSLHDALPILFW